MTGETPREDVKFMFLYRSSYEGDFMPFRPCSCVRTVDEQTLSYMGNYSRDNQRFIFHVKLSATSAQ